MDYAIDQRQMFANDSQQSSESEEMMFVEIEALLRANNARHGNAVKQHSPEHSQVALVHSQNSPVQITPVHKPLSRSKRQRDAALDSSPSPPPSTRRKGRWKAPARKRSRAASRLVFHSSDERDGSGEVHGSSTSSLSDTDERNQTLVHDTTPLCSSVLPRQASSGSETEDMSDDFYDQVTVIPSPTNSPFSVLSSSVELSSPDVCSSPVQPKFTKSHGLRRRPTQGKGKALGALLREEEEQFIAGSDDWLINDMPTSSNSRQRLSLSTTVGLGSGGRRDRKRPRQVDAFCEHGSSLEAIGHPQAARITAFRVQARP